MNAKDLLNMDMEAAVQWLLHFWRWWTTELLGLLPPEWRERLAQRSHVVAEMRGGQLVYRNEENGQPYAVKPRGPVKLMMPAGSALVREVELPLLPMSDIRRMLALDIDRLTPLPDRAGLFRRRRARARPGERPPARRGRRAAGALTPRRCWTRRAPTIWCRRRSA